MIQRVEERLGTVVLGIVYSSLGSRIALWKRYHWSGDEIIAALQSDNLATLPLLFSIVDVMKASERLVSRVVSGEYGGSGHRVGYGSIEQM